MRECRKLRIRGRVQGVGYRISMVREAQRLGLAGWVRNTRDGSVEACIQGSAAAVAALIGWARVGPPAARVDHVEVELGDAAEVNSAEFLQYPTL